MVRFFNPFNIIENFIKRRSENSPIRRNLYSLLAISLFSIICIALLQLTDLPANARNALFLLLLATGLWITEAIPPFAVSLLIMGFSVGFIAEKGKGDHWQEYVNTWASPMIWLLMGGFFLALGATNTGLDKVFARSVLKRFGTKPRMVLLGVMLITLVLSCFMSNTATAALMLAIITPLTYSLGQKDPFSKALVLGVAITAAVGGMSTIIATPANLIAAGVVEAQGGHLSFAKWMCFGIPLAVGLTFGVWLILTRLYHSNYTSVDVAELLDDAEEHLLTNEELLRRKVAVTTIALTILLWVFSEVLSIPMAVISFLPIVCFTVSGIIPTADISKLPWDTLILVAGSLTLGTAVTDTGLAQHFIDSIDFSSSSILVIFIVLAYISSIMSNFMSTTAAASILIPIGATLMPDKVAATSIVIALSVSTSVLLPISTPPNALAYATGVLDSSDFRPIGLMLGGVMPLVIAVLMFVIY